jgi:hypothetical protein
MKRQLLFLFLLSCYSLNAQQTIVEIQNNNLKCAINSRGLEIGFDNGVFLNYLNENGDELGLMASASLWLGGVQEDGNLFVSAPTYGSPAGLGLEGIIPKVFQIDRDVIDQHIADWQDNGVIDNPDPDVFGWPGRGNPFFEQYNDDLTLPTESFLSAPFWDNDGDGIYNPDNGDYPILEVRGCDGDQPIIPTQMNWCVYDIQDPSNEEVVFYVKFNMFFFQCEEESALNNTLFTQHLLINANDIAFTELYGGLWSDIDLGNYEDDYIGTMPERATAYVYNADNQDENNDTAVGFGENPPVFGIDIFRTPFDDQLNEVGINGMIPYYNGSVVGTQPATTDPNTLMEYYNYLKGNWRDGSPLTFGGSGYQTGEPTDFAFPDLPDEEGGWSAFQSGVLPGDPRILMNFGKMDATPGAINEVIAAYTFYDDESDHISKVSGFRDQIDDVQAFFDNCFSPDAFGIGPCTQLTTDIETPNTLDQEVILFPNPTSDRVEVKSDYPITQMHLIDATGRYIATTSESYLHVNALPKGIYFVQIEIQDQVLYKKLIVE